MTRKKVLSTLLALALTLSLLTVPALATGKTVRIPDDGCGYSKGMTLSNVLAVKTVPVTFCYPGEWISDTEFYLEYEEDFLTVYCLSPSGAVLTVEDAGDRENWILNGIGCILDDSEYIGNQDLGEPELQPYSVGPNMRAVNLNMGPDYRETDIHLVTVETNEIYYTYCSLGEYPDGEMEEVVPDETTKGPEGQVTAEGIRVLMENTEFITDAGHWTEFSFTNTTDQPIQGCYGLVSYYPRKSKFVFSDGSAQIYYSAQFTPFDLDLAPGETKTFKQNSFFPMRLDVQMEWIKFDDQAEKDQFIAATPLALKDRLGEKYLNYATFDKDEGEAFLKDNFGITFLPPAD